MEKLFYYIHKSRYGILKFKNEIPSKSFNVGNTLEEYENGYYIGLNDAQVQFAQENPTATAVEIFNMKIEPVLVVEPTIEEVKESKLSEITNFDNSNAVNNFKINDTIDAWFTVAERNNYCASINAAKTVGLETLTFFVGNVKMEVATSLAEVMLAQIQLYADACFIVTKQHKMNVEALSTVDEVNNYDYTVGYPEQLNFQLG